MKLMVLDIGDAKIKMNQQLRTPETHYAGCTFVKFKKEKGITHYYISTWKSGREIEGEEPEGVGSGVVKDQAQIDSFLKCKTLDEILAIHNKENI